MRSLGEIVSLRPLILRILFLLAATTVVMEGVWVCRRYSGGARPGGVVTNDRGADHVFHMCLSWPAKSFCQWATRRLS